MGLMGADFLGPVVIVVVITTIITPILLKIVFRHGQQTQTMIPTPGFLQELRGTLQISCGRIPMKERIKQEGK